MDKNRPTLKRIENNFDGHREALRDPKQGVWSRRVQPRMDTDTPSAAKPQPKRPNPNGALAPSLPSLCPLCLCGGTSSYGNHLRNQEFNHRDAEDTERANNRKQRGHEFNHGETDQPEFLPKMLRLSSLWYGWPLWLTFVENASP